MRNRHGFEIECQDFLGNSGKNRGNSGLEAVLLVIFFKICYYYEKYVHACDSRNIFSRQILAGDAGIHVRICVPQDGLEAFLPRRKTVCGCSGLKKRGGFPHRRADGCGAGRNWASV